MGFARQRHNKKNGIFQALNGPNRTFWPKQNLHQLLTHVPLCHGASPDSRGQHLQPARRCIRWYCSLPWEMLSSRFKTLNEEMQRLKVRYVGVPVSCTTCVMYSIKQQLSRGAPSPADWLLVQSCTRAVRAVHLRTRLRGHHHQQQQQQQQHLKPRECSTGIYLPRRTSTYICRLVGWSAYRETWNTSIQCAWYWCCCYTAAATYSSSSSTILLFSHHP